MASSQGASVSQFRKLNDWCYVALQLFLIWPHGIVTVWEKGQPYDKCRQGKVAIFSTVKTSNSRKDLLFQLTLESLFYTDCTEVESSSTILNYQNIAGENFPQIYIPVIQQVLSKAAPTHPKKRLWPDYFSLLVRSKENRFSQRYFLWIVQKNYQLHLHHHLPKKERGGKEGRKR